MKIELELDEAEIPIGFELIGTRGPLFTKGEYGLGTSNAVVEGPKPLAFSYLHLRPKKRKVLQFQGVDTFDEATIWETPYFQLALGINTRQGLPSTQPTIPSYYSREQKGIQWLRRVYLEA